MRRSPFGQTGLHGTSTEAIARDVGVSQPYLFRLFGTKKELFMAAVSWGFDHTVEVFREAGEAATDQHDAFRRIGHAYERLISDRRYLGIQLQAYASTEDRGDPGSVVKEGFGRLVTGDHPPHRCHARAAGGLPGSRDAHERRQLDGRARAGVRLGGPGARRLHRGLRGQ